MTSIIVYLIIINFIPIVISISIGITTTAVTLYIVFRVAVIEVEVTFCVYHY